MTTGHHFPRENRLRGRSVFAALFTNGKTFNQYPFRITWKMPVSTEPQGEALQAAFVVPKRNFKKAVHRNLLRRRMKEAFRLQQDELRQTLAETGLKLRFVCIYSAKEESPYSEIEKKIIVTLQRLVHEVKMANSGLSTHDEVH